MIKFVRSKAPNMQNKLKTFINLKKLTFLPTWSILIIDICITVSVTLITFLAFKVLGITFYDTIPASIRFSVFFSVLTFYYILFRTYSGIIRYSSLKDATRIFKAVALAFLTIVGIDTINYLVTGQHIYVLVANFFYTIVVFISLISFRISIKTMFKYFTGSEQITVLDKIAIIGVTSNTIALAEAFTSSDSSFKLEFFIDKNKNLNDKKILGVPVVAKPNSIPSILKYNKISHVVLIKNFLPEAEEIELLNDCLRYKINVYNPKLVSGFESPAKTVKALKKYTIEELMFRDTIDIDNPAVIGTFSEKTILVTGGAGSIGSELVKQLAKFSPAKIIVLDQAETPLNTIQLNMSEQFPNVNCVYELINVTNKKEVQKVFSTHQPEIVFHAAAYKHVPVLEFNFMQAIKVNVFGTKNILEAAFQHHVKRFVFVSTDKAVNPTNVMGTSKRIAEILVQSKYFTQKGNDKMQIITTRFGNVLGSNGSVVNLFENQIKEGGPLTVTHPEINRFFMTIPEACKLVLEAGTMGTGGEIFVFDMGKPIFIKDLAEKMIRLSGKEPYEDIDIVFTGLRPGEKLYEEVLAESSKTLATYHPKILIAQDPVFCYEQVEQFLVNLKNSSFESKQELIQTLKELVPEFMDEPQLN